MAKFTFVGGVHPEEGKELSKKKPIAALQAGREMVYPVSQHIGAPAKPVVAKGERVLAGQMIAESAGFVSAPVHSSVSGTVKAIEPRRVVSGDLVDSIVVENDGKYETIAFRPVPDWKTADRAKILEAVRGAGIVGMGGAGFPTHVKLSPKEPEKIDYVIANCAECEPYLTSDYRRMLEEPEKLVEGLRILLALFPNAHGILAVEDNKADCAALLRKLVKDDKRISVKELRTKYPQGAERQLIYASTGRKVHSAMLPADVGCIVSNVDTLVAVWYAVTQGRPLIERIVTVTGDAVKDPRNYKIPIGMSYREILEANGGFAATPEKVICGGPMMGIAMFDLDVPTTKNATALLAFTRDAVGEAEEGPCIRCGRCVSVCPGRVMPNKLADYAEHGDREAFLAYGGMECCECGCCSFICPAKRQLTQNIKSMRKIELANRKNRK